MEAIAQLPLFDASMFVGGAELLLPKEEQQHRFTGELVARNEGKYLGIVNALGQGLSRRQIARAFAVSHHTIQVIFEREPSLVATEKERTGRQLRRVVRMSLDALEEALDNGEIPKGSLPVASAILIDKSLNWDGQSTATVTIRHEVDQEKVRALFDSLRQPVLEAELVTADSASSALVLNSPPIEPFPDHVSAVVAVPSHAAHPATATNAPTGTATLAPQAESGGGGDRDRKGGAHIPIGSTSENLTPKHFPHTNGRD